MELDELYNPQKLYNYLRNHHWKDGIPEDFIQEWSQMEISNYQLSESDELDLKAILKKLGINLNLTIPSHLEPTQIRNKTHVIKKAYKSDNIPCPQKKWPQYKQ